MKPAFIFNQSESEYRAAKPELSQSVIKNMLAQSPAHARYQIDNPTESTPAMRLGTHAHNRILEPGNIRYAVAPAVDRRTTKGKAEYQRIIDENPGKEIITASDMEQIEGMAAAIEAHPLAGRLLQGSVAEVSAFGSINGTAIKGRLDYFHQADGIVVDLKTTSAASPDEAQRYAVKYGLHIQQFVYSDIYRSITGKAPADFVFVLVEKNPPYGVAVVRLTKEAVEAARGQVEKALAIWQQCEKSGIWPGYGDNVITVDLPAWSYRKLEVTV
ncbi:PD-(D/E)XK nuclease-like domain-containing protein [Methylomonas rapida]|uniref:PD-(D/E)XK nuclease-like domain-containing protein n=1 Tax=Methylomonas rapida TaxID=2963939 RepID=A0ABY7GF29_9GAMM|nr:PD-(D/E)XK nuclease-like domain-containing protein [Methylomonas rapida]WAR43880.1 PD-(D/E)XK nuclease-like domain-containing protein [Methylomonas rapida]